MTLSNSVGIAYGAVDKRRTVRRLGIRLGAEASVDGVSTGLCTLALIIQAIFRTVPIER
jgi:hypothetical protein